ncbi:hypothetical protein KVT40_002209 [Elsinoe batatas]|uniref:Uncharacterized protein n=1 Tax=Elsinoe batatas TaxID=2601811 RepID=A0A8K0L876_9PEZI|nr:hypothetical protein KVT40_002209 [Elsinoe batatas]
MHVRLKSLDTISIYETRRLVESIWAYGADVVFENDRLGGKVRAPYQGLVDYMRGIDDAIDQKNERERAAETKSTMQRHGEAKLERKKKGTGEPEGTGKKDHGKARQDEDVEDDDDKHEDLEMDAYNHDNAGDQYHGDPERPPLTADDDLVAQAITPRRYLTRRSDVKAATQWANAMVRYLNKLQTELGMTGTDTFPRAIAHVGYTNNGIARRASHLAHTSSAPLMELFEATSVYLFGQKYRMRYHTIRLVWYMIAPSQGFTSISTV